MEVEYRSSVPDRLGDKVNDGTAREHGPDTARVVNEHRDLLASVAYRVLGSVTDAEDTVQEVWLPSLFASLLTGLYRLSTEYTAGRWSPTQ